jgi:hypothetical protein
VSKSSLVNENNYDISTKLSVSSKIELKEFTYYETAKAWSLLKSGIANCDPEYMRISEVNPESMLNFQDTESIMSLPDHKIPYINPYSVKYIIE